MFRDRAQVYRTDVPFAPERDAWNVPEKGTRQRLEMAAYIFEQRNKVPKRTLQSLSDELDIATSSVKRLYGEHDELLLLSEQEEL